uniref:Uncharacterized protein n=1 Tax=Panagrolaimus davidi TaxID=227884 RepID=A0A914PNE4_9BILA
MASENNTILAATQNSSDESDNGKQKLNYQVKVGRAFTEERYDDGTIIRSCGIDFSFCTKTGEELIDLVERSFTILFDELMGDADNLNLDRINGIFRYDMKSDALSDDEWFGWNEPNFKPTSYEHRTTNFKKR